MTKLNTTQVGRAAEHYVTAEIHRRGGYAACFGGNMPLIDVLASNLDQTRSVTIQVKAKYGGRDWQTSTLRGKAREPDPDERRFWVLVDLRSALPLFYVMQEWWIQNDIHTHHAAYLEQHGGARAHNPDSTHHAINTARVQQWLGRWDELRIFQP